MHPNVKKLMILGGGRGITPDKLPGLAAWYAADYGVLTSVSPDVSATDGQTVRRWLDRSGNGNNADQTVLANQPTLSGGKIVFGTSKLLTHGTSLMSEYSAFAVAKKTTAGAGYNIILYAKQAALVAASNTTDQWGMLHNSGATLSGYDLLTEKCVGVISPASTDIIMLDGSRVVTLSRGTRFTSGSNTIGNNDLNNIPFLGNISELIIYSTDVSLENGKKIIKYLSRKWGVAI